MECFVGQIALFPYSFVPAGWRACDGSSVGIVYHSALFALLGTTFGGNGTTEFNLPNLEGKAPAEGLRYCIAMEGIYPIRG